MWQKVTSIDQLKNISSGAPVINYPLSGRPAEKLSLENPAQIIEYAVFSEPNQTADEIIFGLEIPGEGTPFPPEIDGMTVSGFMSNPPVLHKNATEMIAEGRWWIEV